MDVGVVGSHIARQTASLAMQGEFTKARVQSMSAQRMIHDQRLEQYFVLLLHVNSICVFFLCVYIGSSINEHS